MSYYYAKIRHDFFHSDEMQLLGSRGCVYQMVYLKLILISVPSSGRLELNGVGYDKQALASLTQTPLVELEDILEFLQSYKMVYLDGGTYCIANMNKFIGASSSAKRVREYRERKKKEALHVTDESVTCNTDVTVTSNVYKILDNRNKKIENRNKNTQLPEWSLSCARLIVTLHQQEIDPLFEASDSTLRRWASDIEKIHRLDNRPINQIEEVINFAKKHEFWSKNIISGDKLRKQFPRLVAEMARRTPQQLPQQQEDSPLDDYYDGKISKAEMIRRLYGEEDYQIYIKNMEDEKNGLFRSDEITRTQEILKRRAHQYASETRG